MTDMGGGLELINNPYIYNDYRGFIYKNITEFNII